MKFAVVLNRDGGTLRTADLTDLTGRMQRVFEAAGHDLTIEVVGGKDVVNALDKAVARSGINAVLVGGGDGTVSAAAARLMGKKKALAVLPAGTMNLFARSLTIPQSLNAAIESFANGKIVAVDMASANGEPFVHQFSIGMHAKLVHLRDQMDFDSRLGKIRASARAAWATVNNPPALDVALTIGKAEIITRATAIGITNNLFGEGHLPYAANPAGGVLGIYITVANDKGKLLNFFFNMARGKWRGSEHVEIHQSERVILKIRSSSKAFHAVRDGELTKLERTTTIEIHPKTLNVLVPSSP